MTKNINFFLDRANRKTLKRTKETRPILHPVRITKRGSAYAHTRTGYRPDIGLTLRSGWEANVCRVFKGYGINFEFEEYKFDFPIKRGNKAYIPDFHLPDTDEWLEVKGYFDSNSFIKLKRFKKYYPEHFQNLYMVIGNDRRAREYCAALQIPDEQILIYPEIAREFKDKIINWEG